MTVTNMASQEEEAGSDVLSDEEVFSVSETSKKAAAFTDKMTLFLAHTLFQELSYYFQELPFVSGAHNKCTSLLRWLP